MFLFTVLNLILKAERNTKCKLRPLGAQSPEMNACFSKHAQKSHSYLHTDIQVDQRETGLCQVTMKYRQLLNKNVICCVIKRLQKV